MSSNLTASAIYFEPKAEIDAAARLVGGQWRPHHGETMSDKTEVQIRAEYLLNQRVDRLKRLEEVGAPPLILAREVLLIQKAIWLLDPDAMSAAVQDQERIRVRKESGFCISLDCTSRRQSDVEYCDACFNKPDDDLDEPDAGLN